uniref:Uncharacterized protein n=1 Tax=Pithovirus LCPAC201 TaxID=2506591 RepID=A0A481Z6S4_9VIRU|nr:MAG: hypothetical protein LCPAC201_01010 [Pithovirus LCPAC201]
MEINIFQPLKMEPDEFEPDTFDPDTFDPEQDLDEQITVPPETPITQTGEIDWDNLPDTVGCQIVKKFHDYQRVRWMSDTNRRFQGWVQLCLERLDSPEIIQVPLQVLAGYRALRVVHNIIFSIQDAEDVNAISSMLNLTRAIFIFPTGQSGVNLFRKFLISHSTPISQTGSSGRKYGIIREILSWKSFTFGFTDAVLPLESAFTIGRDNSGNLTAVILTTTRITATAYQVLSLIGKMAVDLGKKTINLVDLRVMGMPVSTRTPEGRIVEERMLPGFKKVLFVDPLLHLPPSGFSLLRLYRHQMLNFLLQGDFGLTDPLSPPGSENPPLKINLPITMRGISSLNTIRSLLTIYVYYIKRLYDQQDRVYVHLDDLLSREFMGFLKEANRKRRARSRSEIDVNHMRFSNLLLLTGESLIRTTNKMDYRDLINLSLVIPTGFLLNSDPGSAKERLLIVTVKNAYRTAKRNHLAYYLTDGSRVNPDGTIDPPN